MLKSYACDPKDTKGRSYDDTSTHYYHNEFERDRNRIIRSSAFRRLQYKTQVFINHEGDHYRNRLTHSIEVASIARSICNLLGISSDLAEAISLSHDLGHTAFGHTGELTLNNCMKKYGGFSHNYHAFKIVTELEERYASYNGLNLTWETLEGLLKHNGPILDEAILPQYILEYHNAHDMGLSLYSSAEAQVASLSDDIAYVFHDIEDSINANLITIEQLCEINSIRDYIYLIKQTISTEIPKGRLIYEVGRKFMRDMICSLVSYTKYNIEFYKVETVYDIRHLGRSLVGMEQESLNNIKLIKDFLFDNVYNNPRLVRVTAECNNIIESLFQIYSSDLTLLPVKWKMKMKDIDDLSCIMSVISDYIAGMTDRFAVNEYRKFFKLDIKDLNL
ncbi:dGTP triphosphohydrolase [Rickettsia endosymbiont of Cardiosporidium cionae]|uniref:dGTP triphosphohydrolase n=1 Tax=Rickettsia endosymbiont of Cardiosporidium cionae TaxID=2777155 RepID=UPI00189527AF|nr:dNTP triphosphohydrolase [Rickettsia endosymbiont of Cardiosporidium cionae]KAF8818478.1 deoxyguanosinetriphosphate triphosphohydrolase [Rickettsia endosymbiont of Cardiosporidium cionae]